MPEFNIQEAMKLRLDGKSYAEIGRAFQMTRESVRQKIGRRPRGEKVVEDIKIPLFKRYFKNNNESIRQFCIDVCGNVDYKSFNRFYTDFIIWIKRENWTGNKKFSVNQMVRIMQKTGSTLEELYKEV